MLLMAVVIAAIAAILAVRVTGSPAGGPGAPGWLAWRRNHWLDLVADDASVLVTIVFLVWFRRARINAEGRGWPQRRARGWAIGGWIVPVINLWFPFQIMGDIWRAGLPPQRRRRTAWLPALWWITWLLAGTSVTSNQVAGRPAVTHLTPAIAPDTWSASQVLLAISGLALAAIVRKVSAGPVGAPPARQAEVAAAGPAITGRS